MRDGLPDHNRDGKVPVAMVGGLRWLVNTAGASGASAPREESITILRGGWMSFTARIVGKQEVICP